MIAPELVDESKRVNRRLSRMLWHDPQSREVPLRINEHGLDAGGAPGLAPEFIAYLRDSGVCFCEPVEIDGYAVFRHRCDLRYRDQRARMGVPADPFHARRITRALRHLRNVAFAEWEIVMPILARGVALDQAREQANSYRIRRGEPELTLFEAWVLWIAGADKISRSY